jgi:hypothetical protein
MVLRWRMIRTIARYRGMKMPFSNVCEHVRIHVRIHVCIHVRVHVRVHARVHDATFTRTYLQTCAHNNVPPCSGTIEK